MIHIDQQKYDDKSKKEVLDELENALNEIERLKKELRKYKNPNTPPSANAHLKATPVTTKRKLKRGAPLGHQGFTRSRKEPDESRHITQDECPNCRSDDLSVVGQQRQQVEELPPDIRPAIIDVLRDVLRCNACHHKFTACDGRTPVQGRFGVKLMVLVIFLRLIVRGVLRKTANFLEEGFALRLAPATVNAIISRTAKAADVEYDSLKKKIRDARIVYVDETSFSVLGKNWWVWVFRSDAHILLVVRPSRGNNVLEEILGKSFPGIVVCDGFRAYDYLENASIQRCWAHLLRKSAELDSAAGKNFHARLTRLFVRIGRFNTRARSEKQRLQKYEQMTSRLGKLVAYYRKNPECAGVAKYVGFRLVEWFTCVRLEGVEATNNFAEQAVRETVIVRKIIGAFRSECGTRVYERLASLLATWKFQGLDVRKELERMLYANMC